MTSGRILGDLESNKLLDIMVLRPTVVDVGEASLWLGGDEDIFGAGRPLPRIAGDIVSILTADENDESRQSK
jgi:hypothetical protein